MSSRKISYAWDDPGLFSHPRSGQHFALCGFALFYLQLQDKSTAAISGYKLQMQVLPSTGLFLWEEQDIQKEEGLLRAELGSLLCHQKRSLSSLQEKLFDSESTMLWILLSQSKGGSIHWVTCSWTSYRLWECNVLMLAEGWIKLLCRIFQQKWQVHPSIQMIKNIALKMGPVHFWSSPELTSS